MHTLCFSLTLLTDRFMFWGFVCLFLWLGFFSSVIDAELMLFHSTATVVAVQS